MPSRNYLQARVTVGPRRVLTAALPLAACAIWCGAAAAAGTGGETPHKKLIEYGWGVPTPDFVRQHVREMEQRPFDGIIFRTTDFDNAFDPRAWNAARMKPQLDTLKAIRWQRFTDNFLALYSANQWKMDWFDDAQWETIEANLRLVSHAVKVARCVGVCFDPEPYGPNPWAFETAGNGHSYAETAAMVRKRGAQFMRALRKEAPDLHILTLFHLSHFADVARIPDRAKRDAVLAGPSRRSHWGLLTAFVNGWLDGSSPRTVMIDGNENSYYFSTDEEFYRDYYSMKHGALPLVPPETQKIYQERVQPGAALYMDQLVALREPKDNPIGESLTPSDRLLWLEHNTYMALLTSEEYVWCYSEKMSWWENKVPDGAEEAIRRAREKVDKGEPLGFDIKAVMARRKH